MPGTFTYVAATNIVTVTGGTSGSPADFASFVAADRAGAGTSLLAAWSPTSNTKALTYQLRPVELLALLISFVVDGKTTEPDYIFITGTDAWGVAQTESIDIGAGNGTYVTTKRFRTITNIDCSDNAAGGGTVWDDGAVAVTQPIWGVIWDKGNRQYQLDAIFNIGDASSATYFAATKNAIYLSLTTNYQLYVRSNAVCRFGTLIDAGKKSTKDGCYLYSRVAAWGLYGKSDNNGSFLFYSSILDAENYTASILLGSGTHRVWNCIQNNNNIYGLSTTSDVFNTVISGTYNAAREIHGSIDKLTIYGSVLGIFAYAVNGAAYANLFVRSVTRLGNSTICSADTIFINLDTDNKTWTYSGTCTGKVYFKYTIDFVVKDNDGVAIEGATVTLVDNTKSVVFSENTIAGGVLATGQKTVIHGYYDQAHGDTLQEYGPHTLTITAPGYQTYQDVITIDRKMDLEVALGPVPPPVYMNVPSGEMTIAVSAPESLEVSLEAGEISLELSESQ